MTFVEANEARDGLRETLKGLMARTTADGSAGCVVYRGRLLAESGLGVANRRTGSPMTSQTTFEIASQTKLMTTMALLALASSDRVSVNDPITNYIDPGRFLDADAASQVTLDHCMRHSAGFGHVTHRGLVTRPLHASGFSMFRARSSSCLVSHDGPLEVRWKPGSLAQYSNVGAALLAEVLEVVCAKPYAEVLHDLIFCRLKMSRTTVGVEGKPEASRYRNLRWLFPFDVYPRWKGIAGAISTVRDLGRLVATYTSSATASEVLDPALLHASVQPDAGLRRDLPSHVAGWRREMLTTGLALMHQAGTHPGMTVKAAVLPERHLGVVLLVNKSARPEIHGSAIALLRTLAKVARPTPTPTDGVAHGRYEGRYVLDGSPYDFPTFWADCGRSLLIEKRQQSLVVSGSRLPASPLTACDGVVGFTCRSSRVPLHLVTQAAAERLLPGGPYTGARLCRSG